MSDHIDELVAEAEFLNDNGCDKCEIVTRLAIIAREAERDTLQEERDEMRDMGHWLSDEEWHAGEKANEDFLGRYNALLAEHEASRDIVYALGLGGNQDTVVMLRTNGERESVMLGTGRNQDTVVTRLGPVICRRFLAAHDNAERVMRGE